MNRPSLDPGATHSPALALLEWSSVAAGFERADRVLKAAEVELLLCEAVTPGKFLVMFAGDVEAVASSLSAVDPASDPLAVDHLFLPHAHPSVLEALRARRAVESDEGAVGVLEMDPIAPLLEAADRMAKSATVELVRIRAALRLAGRAYCIVQGPLSQVEAAIALGLEVGGRAACARHVVLARPHADLHRFLD